MPLKKPQEKEGGGAGYTIFNKLTQKHPVWMLSS